MILRHQRTPSQVTQFQYPYCVLRGRGHGTIPGPVWAGRRAFCRWYRGRYMPPSSGTTRFWPIRQRNLRLEQAHGTVAVDLESHVAARIATARNLSIAACSVILDPASRRLPPAALAPSV
jgi:hypothetical protein